MPAFDFNALLSGLSSLAGVAGPLITAGENRDANQNLAGQAQWSPSPITLPGLGLAYNPATGGYLGSVTDPTNQNNAQNLMQMGGSMLGNYSNMSSMLPFAQNEFNTSAGIMNGMTGPNSLGAGFETAGRGFLSSLGSMDPNQLASSYTQNLRTAALPQEQNAAASMAQQLFNSGRLGSTGGATLMGNLAKQIEEADIQRVIAGQQYGGQEQSRVAGLAGQLGQLGQNMQLSPTQQRFQNAMQLFGAGETERTNTLQGALSTLGLGTQTSQLDIQNLMTLLGASGNLSASRSLANMNAFSGVRDADVAQNNTIGSLLGGLGDLINSPSSPIRDFLDSIGLGGGAAGGLAEGLTGALPSGAGGVLSQLAPNATSSLPSSLTGTLGGLAEGLTGALPAGSGSVLSQLAPNATSTLPSSITSLLGGAGLAGAGAALAPGVTAAAIPGLTSLGASGAIGAALPGAATAAGLGGTAAGAGAAGSAAGSAGALGGLGAAGAGLGVAAAAYGVFSLINGFAKNVGEFSIDPATGTVSGQSRKVAAGKGRGSGSASQDAEYSRMLTQYLQTGQWQSGGRGVGDGGRAVRSARAEIDKFRQGLGLRPGQPVPPGTFGGQ